MSRLIVREVPVAQTRPLRQAVLRPHQSVQEMAADEAHEVFAVAAFDEQELIAVGMVAPDGEPGGWRVRGMATAPHARGRGAGRAGLDALIAHAVRRGASRIWCNARAGARGFYERAGFEVRSQEFTLPEIGAHFVMELRELRYPAPPQMEP